MISLLVTGLFLTGCSSLFGGPQTTTTPNEAPPSNSAPPATTPTESEGKTPPVTAGTPTFPGDMQALEGALSEPSPLTYKLIPVDTPKGTDLNAYLDFYIEQNGSPGKNEVWLLIFPNDGHNMRFVMGALLFEKKVTVEQMLDLARNHYFPKARTGDPAAGLADLIRSVNQIVK